MGNVTGTTGATNVLEPKSGYRMYVLPRGAHAAAASVGTNITFDSSASASRFAATNWVQIGLSTDNIRQVSAVGGNSISVNTAVTVAQNDRVFRIGSTQPAVSGGSATYQPATTIYQRDDNAASAVANSRISTNADGFYQFFADPAVFDAIVQDSNQANVLGIADIAVDATSGGFLVAGNLTVNGALGVTGTATFGSTVTINAGLTVSNTGYFGATVTCLQGVTIGTVLSVNYNTLLPGRDVAVRVGGRAQTTGIAGEKWLVYASEEYSSDLGPTNETFALYGINTISGAVAAGAEQHGAVGEVQFSPTTAKVASAICVGVQGIGRFGGTHAGCSATSLQGGAFGVVTSSGSTGIVQNFESLHVNPPLNSAATVEIHNARGLVVIGGLSTVGTALNQIAYFGGGTDESSDFVINSCPIRIDDDANEANAVTAGRWVDIFRTWDGTDGGSPLFVGLHMDCTAAGTFTANDDLHGFRSVTRTGTASGDGANLDIMSGYQAFVQHRSSQLLDEMYGFHADMTVNGTSSGSILNTMAGFDCRLTSSGVTISKAYSAILRTLTPSSGLSSTGHVRMVPVSLATPSTTLATMSGAEEGTLVFITDSNNANNSGLYMRVNSTWQAWTPKGVTAASDS